MATTISSGRSNSPLLTANIADHGTIYGGRGLIFDGVTDYLSATEDVLAGESQGTISFWTKTSGTGNQAILGYHRDQWSIRFNKTTMFLGVGGTTVTASSSLDNSTWGFHTITYNSGTAKFYKNGELYDTDTSFSGSFPANTNGIFIGKRNHASPYYYNGTISDVKIFNSALTEAQIQELYLKPEQSAPSAVQANLKQWYPMCEGNPDSPQSIVYDHSEKKLGSNVVVNGTFDADSNWSKGTGWTISDGKARCDGSASGNTNLQTSVAPLSSGKLYKVTFDLTRSAGNFRFLIGSSGTTGYYTTDGTHSFYMVEDGNDHVYAQGDSNFVGTLDNVIIKEVLMGNHATTNFYGAELWDDNYSSGIGNWAVYSPNAIANDSGAIKITADASSPDDQGALINLKSAHDLNADLTVGKTYELKINTKVDSGNAVDIRVYHGTGYVATTGVSNTDFAVKTITLTATHATNGFIKMGAMQANEIIWLKDFSFKEVGISSSGFATADSEPTIPQVPLLRYNEKMVFDGADGVKYVDVGDIDVGANFTVSAWILKDDITSYGYILDKLGDAGNRTFHFRVDNTGKLQFGVFTDGTAQDVVTTSNVVITANKLHHVVAVKNGSACDIYVDGVLVADNGTSLGTPYNSTFGLRIGHYNALGGMIDEVSIFNTALSSTEVQELFADGVALDATTHSKADYLMGYWRNDGVSSWVDRSDIQAISFDGADDKIEIADGEYDFGTVDFSISIWAYSDWTNDEIFLSKGSSNPIRAIVSASGGTNHRINWNLYKSGTPELRIYTPTDGLDNLHNEWCHFVLTCDRDGNAIAYLNGVAGTPVDVESIGDLGSAQTMKLGSSHSSNYFNGLIGQTAIWHKVLSSSEISAIYALGRRDVDLTTSYSTDLKGYWLLNPTHSSPDVTGSNGVEDRSTNSNHGTQSGTVSFLGTNNGTPAGTPESIIVREGLNSNKDGLGFPFTHSDSNVLRLDGVKDYISIPDSSGLTVKGSFTLEFWYKQESGSTSNQDIIASDDDSNRNFGVRLSSGKVFFIVWYDGGSAKSIMTDNAVSDGKWKHIACVLTTGTSMTTWVDGVSTKTDTSSVPTTIDDDPTPFKIGTKTTTSEMFKGLVDEIRFYHKALSPAEISKNYKHGKGKHKN